MCATFSDLFTESSKKRATPHRYRPAFCSLIGDPDFNLPTPPLRMDFKKAPVGIILGAAF